MSSGPIVTDKQQLLSALRVLLGISREALSPKFPHNHHQIYDALRASGIKLWSQLVTIRDSDIDDLMYDASKFGAAPAGHMVPLNIAHKGQVRSLIAYYHYESRRLKHEALPTKMDPADFDHFRASIWDPNMVPTPWTKPLPSKELTEWQKVAKPTASDYPVLTDNTNMNRFIEQWESVAKAHRLGDTLIKGFRPLKHLEDLYKQQKLWMFLALTKQIKHASARPFVTKHITDMDAAAVGTRSRSGPSLR